MYGSNKKNMKPNRTQTNRDIAYTLYTETITYIHRENHNKPYKPPYYHIPANTVHITPIKTYIGHIPSITLEYPF